MDGAARRTLTLVEAKDALRTAAEAADTAVLPPMGPHRAMLLALLAGVLVGTAPDSRKRLARVLAYVIFPDRPS